MTPERWQKIEEIFHEALELEAGERSKFLEKFADIDTDLKAEVEKLLSQFEKASGFIEQPMYEREKNALLLSLFDENDTDPIVGQILGNYRILREIGRGGMGAVYEAERADGEFRLRVALKVVKRGVDTDFVLRRFRNERQILAALDHPFITRLIDGGTTPDGRPYFVMELIDGVPLYRYCDKNKLSINERLRLFCRVCEAVQHAHDKKVIHRDLKPSNIFVTNDGTPRLLDFGIAKLLDPEMASDTLQPTATALRMMTIDYASPEQVRGEKVTYSTDVYSLGVVLYELLTECRPYQISSRSPHDIARAVCDSDPLLPSDVLSGKVSGVAVTVSKSANTLVDLFDTQQSRDRASNQVRGNLDNILMKTLQKEPSRRYKSVADLSADIDSHLAGKVVDAPPYISIEKTKPDPSRIQNVRLLAVLPLRLLNFSPTENTDENYLSIGLADAIISRLTSVRDFTVRPTSSISGYEKSDVDPLQAGRELGVDFVLDGRIKKYGETLRISLQMLDVQKASTVWAGQFDEEFTDVLTLEDAISEQVADALVSQITGESNVRLGKRGTDNPKAYEAYLKGRFYWNQFTPDALPKAIEQFQKAVELDPDYALAHVGVADFYIWANIYGIIPSLEATRMAETAINKALAIDDQLGEAYATHGLINQNRFDWPAALSTYPKAIELNPNYPHAYEWYAAILIGSGQTELGIKQMEKAEELDPVSLRTKTMVVWDKYQAGQYAEALKKADEIIDLDGHYPQGHLQKGNVLIQIGDPRKAVAEIERGMESMADSALAKYYYCFALAAADRLDDARKVWEEMKASPSYVKPMFLGLASVAVGEFDDAFKYLNQAVDECDPWLVWLATDIKLEPIRKDKRYLDLLKRTKNPIVDKFEQELSDGKKSVAVLPLQLIGTPTGSFEDEFLGLGLADAMITRLSKLRRIVVRPTSSVVKFSAYDDAFAIANELNVDFVLCGTLRRASERVRISAQLLDVSGRSTVWAEKFDENFTDVLDLEDVVSDKVARLLIPQLTGEERQKLAKRGTNSPEAYEAYLKGRTNWLNSTPEGFAKALICFNEAIAIDPGYAAPYAGIADYHNFLSVFGIMAPHDSFPAAIESAQKALDLDAELGEAYVSLAMTAYSYEWDFEKCGQLFLKALDLIPNSAAAHMWYAHFLSLMGRNDEALYHIGRSHDIAPNNYSTFIIHAFVLRNARRHVESRQKLIEAHTLQPGHYLAMQAHSWNVLALENYDEAEREGRKAVAADTGLNMSSYALAFVLAAAGKRDEALEIANNLIDIRKKTYVPPCYLAQIFTALGDKDKAFEWFEISYDERDCWTPWLARDPRFDLLRDDPRYFDLLGRTGISEGIRNFGHEQKTAIIPVGADTGEVRVDTADVSGNLKQPKSTILRRHKYKFAVAGLAAVLIAAGYSTGVLTVSFDDRRVVPTTNNPAGAKRIIAIPSFSNATGNPENDFLCQGLSENLIGRLQPNSGIQVLPNSAGLRNSNSNVLLRPLADGVQIDTVILGKLNRYADDFEIFLEFVDTKTGSKTANVKYEGKIDELAAIENRMAADIVKQLVAGSAGQKPLSSKSYTENSEAFEQYLKGEYHRQKGSPEGVRKAVEFYKKALELDANYALAHQGLALTYRTAPAYGTIPPNEAYPLAKQSALTALTLDPTLGSAHIPLASIKFVWDWDFKGAEAEYKQAIQIVPNNSEAHYSYGNFLVAMGRFDEAISELKIAQQFDPLSPMVASNVAWALYIAGRFGEAEAQAKQLLERDPNFARGHLVLGEIYVEQGNLNEAIAELEKSRKLSDEALTQMVLGHAYAVAGRTREARNMATDLETRVMKKEISPFMPVEIYVGLGDRDRAFYWLERSYQERSNWLALSKVGRRLKQLRGDARFDALLKRIGFE